MSALDVTLEPLVRAEAQLGAAVGVRASLDPGRACATPLPSLGERMLRELSDPTLWLPCAEALARVALCQLEHYPRNLFWDLDYPALYMARTAACSDAPRAYLADFVERMEGLLAAYGHHSTIRFRYVHDFIYGFDWERWVAAAPEERGAIGPFDLPYLERSLARGVELAHAIESGDPVYPRLAATEFRNPFGFGRAPVDELRLHRELLARGLIPVRAFDPDARPAFTLGASRAREALAKELGLSGLA